jgi:hypothetical protein
MKTVNDLTESELVALSDEELERYIDIECAERGVPMLPPEPIPPSEPFIPYDVIAYTVAHFDFQNREDAEAVAAIINGKPRARYESTYPHYEQRFVGWSVQERAHVEEKPILSTAQQMATKAEREKHAADKKAYDEQYTEYRKILGDRSDVGDEVRERRWTALRSHRDRDENRARFAHYMTMADGNRSIAYRFFEKSYGHELVKYPELRSEFEPPVEDAAA